MNDPKIIFLYESDGDLNNKTHYIIARHPNWQDVKRLDCNQFPSDIQNKNQARKVTLALQHDNITMEQAATKVNGTWL